jgi:hypothetical protein
MTKGLHHFSLALLTDGYPSLSVGQVTLQRLLVFYISSHKCFILICNSKSISMHDTMCILHASCTKHVHLHHQDTCSQSLISALIRFFFLYLLVPAGSMWLASFQIDLRVSLRVAKWVQNFLCCMLQLFARSIGSIRLACCCRGWYTEMCKCMKSTGLVLQNFKG